MTGDSFDTVLAAARDGDAHAFARLWRELNPKVFRYLRTLAPAAASDLASETWLQVIRSLAGFSGDESAFRGWVFTIARNKAIDRLRAGGRSRAMESIDAAAEIADTAPLPEQSLAQGEDNARLKSCLGGLAANERNALHSAFFDGNTYEELALRMNVPLGTMKSWIRRALQKLKACLER